MSLSSCYCEAFVFPLLGCVSAESDIESSFLRFDGDSKFQNADLKYTLAKSTVLANVSLVQMKNTIYDANISAVILPLSEAFAKHFLTILAPGPSFNPILKPPIPIQYYSLSSKHSTSYTQFPLQVLPYERKISEKSYIKPSYQVTPCRALATSYQLQKICI